VVLDEQVVDRLFDDIENDPGTDVTVDLITRQVRWDREIHLFEMDDYIRWRLLEGLDDIELTLRHSDAIAAYETVRRPWLPAIS
jgi:3-isopropylmalate/(R)-2-methylmalate dehydratase small subunit